MPPIMLHPQQRCRKTAILTRQGFQKLEAAKYKVNPWNAHTTSYTLEMLSEYTGLSPHTLSKIHARKVSVDRRSLIRYFNAFNLTLEPDDYIQPLRTETNKLIQTEPIQIEPMQVESGQPVSLTHVSTAEPLHRQTGVSWGMAPDVSQFYGRSTELATLQKWILDGSPTARQNQRCRVITLLGMGGVGKTWLATKLAEQMQHEFNIVIWRSLQQISRLQHPMPFSDFIDDLLRHLPLEPAPDLPETTCLKIQHLMDCLRRHRCLLVLDNFDSVLQRYTSHASSENGFTKTYRSGYEAYGELLHQVGNGRHQSCIILTSREEPKQMQRFSGNNLFVRVLPVEGLQVAEVQQLFSDRGAFQGSPDDWMQLANYYGGNPLILEIVATTIHCLFGGNITEFFRQNTLICDDICELLEQQLEWLSASAQEVMNVLATQNAPLSLADLRFHISPSTSTAMLLGLLKSLKARSLIEGTTCGFFLQPLLKDYWRDRLFQAQAVDIAEQGRLLVLTENVAGF